VYRNSDLAQNKKIRLIAMPGNHESLVGEKGAQGYPIPAPRRSG
jgi:hypothetical protein